MIIYAPISAGELLDKLSILTIKLEKITDTAKLKNILREHVELKKLADEFKSNVELPILYDQLLQVNRQLWDIEDNKRKCEKLKKFDDEFIELARQVYIKNDIRAHIKKEINLLMNSTIVEEKSY